MYQLSRLFVCLLLCIGVILSCKKDDGQPNPTSVGNLITANPTVTGVSGASVSVSGSTYTLTVPAGTNIKALKISIPVASGSRVDPDPGVARDYTSPVSYTITAADGGQQTIRVTVLLEQAPKSSEKQITAFSFAALNPAVQASTDQTTRKITATVPASTDLTKLVPTLTVSSKASVSPASGVAQNFTNPVSYTVTAEDGSKQEYEVKVDKQAVVNSTVPCLLTRVEDASNSNEYIAYEYTSEGRLSKMTATQKFGLFTFSFEYDQAGNLVKWIKPDGYYDALSYTNGKLTSYKLYKNGVLVTGTVNGPDGEYIKDFVLNENNEMLKYKSDVFSYENSNLVKYENYDGPNKLGEYRMEYDAKKHHLSASKPKGIFGAVYYFAMIGSEYGPLLNFTTSFNNNLVKLTTDDGKSIRYSYLYNNSNFPTQAEISFSFSNEKFKLKYIYSNCQ
ncbi:DUF5018 domain-containing protein [Spirosoma fluminis]